ncbi:hypothetical protein [Pseudonocardia sp. P1]
MTDQVPPQDLHRFVECRSPLARRVNDTSSTAPCCS